VIPIDGNSQLKNHYNKISRYFTYAKFITLIVLVFFLLFAFQFYRDDITIENFRYMIKYLDFAAPENSAAVSNTTINFGGDADSVLTLYRNDLAVVKRMGLDLFDLEGQKIFSSEHTMSSPSVACGNKFMLVFDLGGTHISLYNTFSKIWETDCSYPIIDATINDEGEFCIATSEKGYTSVVYVYNSNFEPVYSWRSGDKYITDVSMSSNGNFVISTIRAQDGFYISEATLLSVNKSEIIASVTLYDQIIMEVSGFEKFITILTDKAITFFDASDMKELTSVHFSRDSLHDFVSNDNYSALVLSKKIIGSENEISVYRRDGTHVSTFASQGHIIDVCLTSNSLYKLSSGSLTIYNLETLEEKTLTVDKRFDELISDNNTVILANASEAVTIEGE